MVKGYTPMKILIGTQSVPVNSFIGNVSVELERHVCRFNCSKV